MKPERRWAYVRWIDSCMFHEQHDEHELPTPSVLESCGWVVAETADYVTLARDIHDRAGSAEGRLEGIRSACSIPRACIQAVVYLTTAQAAEPAVPSVELVATS